MSAVVFPLVAVGTFLFSACSSISSTEEGSATETVSPATTSERIAQCQQSLAIETTRRIKIQNEHLKLVQWRQEHEKKYQQLAQKFQKEAGDRVHIHSGTDQLTITVLDQILFDSGETSLKASGVRVLQDIGPILHQVTDHEIRIEGHTDNFPLRRGLRQRYPSNWELSTARATEVIRYLIDQHGVEPESLQAIGYGHTRPIASNATEDGRQQNRRIEIVLSPKMAPPMIAQGPQ